MKYLLMSATLLFSITGFAETKKECKKKGFEFDKKTQSCKQEKTKKREKCEKQAGTWKEESGKCEGQIKLKGKEKKALKLVEEAAKNDQAGSQLSQPELIAMAKDLASYAKRNKVKLDKIKISFADTGTRDGIDGKDLKRKVIKEFKGFKLYHIEEGTTEKEKVIEGPDEVLVERAEADIEIPTNFFPPNYHQYTDEGRENLLNAIINGADDDFHVFNITIVESSASRLANTAGDFDFSPSDNNQQKQQKLLGLAMARSNSTEAMLKKEFPDLLITNKKNAIISGPADCFGTGDTSGQPAPANVVSACKGQGSKKTVSEHYNQFQYVKLHVEYMKETPIIKKILETEIEEIENARGILAKFEHNKKYKSKITKRNSFKKFFKKFKIKTSTKKYKPKRNKSRGKYRTLDCPKF